MAWLSQGVEALAARKAQAGADASGFDFDVIVVGSGYGGSVAACRFAEAGYRVCLLERGPELQAGQFPDGLGSVPGQVRLHRPGQAGITGRADALFDLRMHRGASVLVANALGGGSQINANVALRADPAVLRSPCWPRELREQYDPLDTWYSRAEDMLGVAPYPHPSSKADALAQLAEPLSRALRKGGAWADDREPVARFYRPPLAITYRDGPNRFGVAQNACTGCGDCVSGCNYGAKNTLTMNYLPQARRLGAEIYTGATVLAVSPGEAGDGCRVWLCYSDIDWTAHLAEGEPRGEAGLAQSGILQLRARIAVLAAGSLGSTEILLRSRELGLLKVSERLGTSFSGNGDALGFVYDQDRPVNAVGWGAGAREGEQPGAPPGPTIVGVLDVREGVPRSEAILLEDGILPGPIATLCHELLTTAAMLQQLGEPRLHRDGPDEDPVALCDEAMQRTQVLLAMGHDESNGTMALERGRIVVRWPGRARAPRLEAAVKLAAGASGGVPLANPIAQPLPESLAEFLSGPSLDSNTMVVHPLGGCPMGDDFATGVVDHSGAVFSGVTPRSLHGSLYVWDGAAVPGSLGVNPFLTITALAERAAAIAIQRLREADQARTPPKPADLPPRPQLPRRGPPPATVEVELQETLRGTLRWLEGGTPTDAPACAELRSRIADMATFLKDPGHRIASVAGELHLPALDASPLAVTGGEVAMFVRVPGTRLGRTLRGLGTWFAKRGHDDVARAVRNAFEGKPRAPLFRLLKGLMRLSNHVGEERLMRYTVRLVTKSGERYTLEGTKFVRYARHSNFLDSLLDLHVELRRDGDGRVVARGVLRLDLVALAENDLPQVLEAADTPQAGLALIGLCLFFTRVVLKTYLWDFRQPDYPSRLRHGPLDPERPLFVDRIELGPTAIDGERHWITARRSDADAATLPLALTRLRPPGGMPVAPVLLLAGFAQSARAFVAEPLEEDLVRHLLRQGFEVWLFDYRTSTALPSCRTQSSLDDVAKHDIPTAVDYVRQQTGGQPIAALGHCMGSATLAMSLLSGRLLEPDGSRSKLLGAVLSQVPPFIVGGAYSQWRRQLAALLRDYLRVDCINLAADDGVTAWEAVMDRLFATLPVGTELCPHEHHRARPRLDIATCKRVSGIIGPLYRHDNMGRMHATLDRYFGWAAVSVFNQISKFFEYERLVSDQGLNLYVHDEGLRAGMRLPLLLMHGAENKVFDPESSRRTLEQLRRVNPDGRYELFEPKGYAHFDCIAGDRAHADIYPKLSDFLRRAAKGSA